MTDENDYSVDDLIAYLDTGLSIETLREMDRHDLYKLRDMLYHWHQLAERIYFIAELRAEDRALKRWRDRLAAHPDPRDPNHPGFDESENNDD